jgi:succinoglycan biosynthesis protein ExoM
MPRVSICVATYRRPDGLRRLLDGLARLRFDAIAPPEIEVLVVDNEASGRAADSAALALPHFPWVLRLLEEPQRGITFARNRGLRGVRPDADFVAFIDDDEEPQPAWLEALLLAQQRYAADVVTGPVVPRFEAEVPSWVVRGGFFGPRQQADGRSLEVAFTNNVLMRASIPGALGRAFDDRFALTGGEDTDFFMRAHRAGFRIVWAAHAVVSETVPASRTTLGWLLRRGYREWGSHSRCEKALYPSLTVRAERIVKATALIGLGVASFPIAVLLGRHHMARSLLSVARGAGSFGGLLGRHYAEYADRTPQPPGGTNSASSSGYLE